MVLLEQLIYCTYSELLKWYNNSPREILFLIVFLGFWEGLGGGGIFMLQTPTVLFYSGITNNTYSLNLKHILSYFYFFLLSHVFP